MVFAVILQRDGDFDVLGAESQFFTALSAFDLRSTEGGIGIAVKGKGQFTLLIAPHVVPHPLKGA